MATPMWIWCAAPGAARTTAQAVDIADYGDGYTHRSTRGLNPSRPVWALSFPFESLTELGAMDTFLRSYSVPGFWFRPPDSGVDLYATCDEWSSQIVDRSSKGDMLGQLTATFKQAFNPQPIT